MSGYTVRDYKSDDFPDVVRIWEATSMGSPERGDNQDIIEQSIRIGGRLLLLIEDATGKVTGTSWMTFDGRRIHLHHFGIDPPYQGRGLSKILLGESLRHVRKKGYQVKIEVHRSNIKAINLYLGMGFKQLGDYDVYIIRDVREKD
jgi:ribosomal protein S18 acetylase RimI-like enzyme